MSVKKSNRRNVIPRKFNKIVVKVLYKTNLNEPNDIMELFKDDYGYHTVSLRTGVQAWANLSMLRNAEFCEFLEVT